jgi:hypothetical protein
MEVKSRLEMEQAIYENHQKGFDPTKDLSDEIDGLFGKTRLV